MKRAVCAGVAAGLVAAGLFGCVSAHAPAALAVAPRIEVLTPEDGVPITDDGVWLAEGSGAPGSEPTLRELRHDLAAAFSDAGAEVCEGRMSGPSDKASRRWSGSVAGDGVDAVVVTELIAYGQLRKSWIWLLAGQAVVAGVGHGVAASRLTGNPAAGLWVGVGEWALETATWVGGALFASHWIDPVIVRVTVYRAEDGARLGRWTREGLRPLRSFGARGAAVPRPERLRKVFDRISGKLAAKVVTRVARSRDQLPEGS